MTSARRRVRACPTAEERPLAELRAAISARLAGNKTAPSPSPTDPRMAQFLIFALSAPIFLAGLVLATGYDQPLVAIIGSIGVFLGATLFAVVACRLWMSDTGA